MLFQRLLLLLATSCQLHPGRHLSGNTWIRRELKMVSAKMTGNRGFLRNVFAAVGEFRSCRLSPPEVLAYGLGGVFSLPVLGSEASWLTIE